MQKTAEFVGTPSLTPKKMPGYLKEDNLIVYTFVQGWKYGDISHNSAGKLRSVRFVASKIGDESLECPLAKTPPPPLTSVEKLIRKGKRNRQDIATFTITVYYTKALG